ncbi:MAG: efflux RND transporter permease subunit [Synergistaceae bacterium]|nr:efflux RND transporter permease subunit [Synergistaceae bacterium]
MFSKFFIRRPRFAIVLASILMISGALCAFQLPVTQYPNLAPPQIRVMASYPGADAQTIATTVGTPLEEALNGVEKMIYMSSSSSNNGSYGLTITFENGTNSDLALIKVQNRVQQVVARLPQIVNTMGITVISSSSSMIGFVAIVSPNGTRDTLFLTDYAINNVRNRFRRIPGMGEVSIMGTSYSIRIWLDPEKLSSMGLSVSDVQTAIRGQNVQAALGSVGASPATGRQGPVVYSMLAKGRLSTVSEFEEIILKRSDAGDIVRLKDISRVELGSESYSMSSTYLAKPCAMLLLSQTSDANVLEVMQGVKDAIAELSRSLPEDVEFAIPFDSTDFVKVSIREIIMTLFMTLGLVIFVCYLFLQNWRVTLVPSAAIPVSLLASFISLSVLGYNINTFTLFGLVLVIGTVVDDAIVVVERVLYIMEHEGLGSVEATERAMRDVSGPMIATTLVFLAIFVPVAMMSGITGQIYKQFGVTMSFAVVCSTFVAFTLSPAMCAHLLTDIKPKMRGPLAWFNKGLNLCTGGFVRVSMLLARSFIVLMLCLVASCAASWYIMKETPTTFIPDEDKGAIMGMIQLPEGASRERTSSLVQSLMPEIAEIPGVRNNMAVEGYSFMGGSGENMGLFVVSLQDWGLRETPDLSQSSILAKVNAVISKYTEASIIAFAMAGVPGLGVSNGLEMKLQATGQFDTVELEKVTKEFSAKLTAAEEIMYAYSPYTAQTPHLFVDVDRVKAERMGLELSSIFSVLGTYFGTSYVNDINIGSHVNRVMLQSDWEFRNSIEDVGRIRLANIWREQVPLSSVLQVREITAPRNVSRYNLYPCAEFTIMPAAGYSTGQVMQKVAELSRELPEGYAYEWSGQTYQEQREGNQFMLIIGSAVIFGFLFLVAQYESWLTPVGVMLSLPIAILGALAGIVFMGITTSVYTQLGMLLLVGLATKNAILIIEFAKEERELRGASIREAAAEAARERFRSVLMTAFTCVLGAAPMLLATGAGAASRIHVGTVMFFGMTVATVLGIFLIPGLFVMMQTFREGVKSMLGMESNYDDDSEYEDDEDDEDEYDDEED